MMSSSVAIACGNEHVVVVGEKGDVYAWGRGSGGRLGLGHEEDCCTPQEVKINTEEVYVMNVKCSSNATMLLSDKGVVYACGGNRQEKGLVPVLHGQGAKIKSNQNLKTILEYFE